MRSHLITALDIGTTRTTALIAEVQGQQPTHWIEVLGIGQVKTLGEHHDVTKNVQEMSERVRRAVGEAEAMAGSPVGEIYVGISGDQIQTFPSLGVAVIDTGEVTPADVDEVKRVARAVSLPPDRQLLHTVPRSYRVDDSSGIRHPIGMRGIRLELDVYLVTGTSSIAGNIHKAVEDAGYQVEKLILEPLAAARAVLREDEKELGVAVLDFGGNSTQVAVFLDGQAWHTNILQRGGVNVTWDVVQRLKLNYPHLRLQYEQVRRLIEDYGTVDPDRMDTDEFIEIRRGGSAGGPEDNRIALSTVTETLTNNVGAMLGWHRRELETRDLIARLGAGVVLTGGGAALKGIAKLAERKLGTPVRIGTPEARMSGSADSLNRPNFSTVVGVAQHGADRFVETGKGALTHRPGMFGRIGTWIKEFF